LQSLKRTAIEVALVLAWLACIKSPTGGPCDMLLYEIKVLLGYLVCSVTSASNAVDSLECTPKCAKTMGAHLENRTYKQVMATFATFILTQRITLQ